MEINLDNHLSLEELSCILPKSEKIDFNIPRINRIVYTTVNGKYLPIAKAKIVKNNISYNIVTDYYIDMGCEYICLVVDRVGVLLMPVDVLKYYHKFSGWKIKTTKGKQYWIRGVVRDRTITLINSIDHSKYIDANKYFYPFKG